MELLEKSSVYSWHNKSEKNVLSDINKLKQVKILGIPASPRYTFRIGLDSLSLVSFHSHSLNLLHFFLVLHLPSMKSPHTTCVRRTTPKHQMLL